MADWKMRDSIKFVEELEQENATLKKRVEELEAIQKEQQDIVFGNYPLKCRNGESHPFEEGCLYCRAEQAESRIKELELIISQRQSCPATACYD